MVARLRSSESIKPSYGLTQFACLYAFAACAWLWACLPAVAGTIDVSGTFSGSIAAGDTVRLIDGASIVGDVSNDGTLDFALTQNLAVSNAISGSGAVILSGSTALSTGGTITFSGSNSYGNGTTIRLGELVVVPGGLISHPGANMTVGAFLGDVGALTISGGNVSSLDGTLGQDLGSTGSVLISAGTWTIAEDLNVGYAGTGTLSMTGGRIDIAGSALLGRDAGSLGTFTVSGGTMAVTSALQVGFGGVDGSPGVGTLSMTGGVILSEDGYIGSTAFSSGTATITSGTWTLSRDLYVGLDGGDGTLTIGSGGAVAVAGDLVKDAAGTINLLGGGSLIIGLGGTTGSLSTELVNDGLLEFNRSTNYQHDYLISGTGSVVKNGTGILTFTQSNSYSGGTTILGGSILVASGASISHDGASVVIGDATGAIGALSVTGGTVEAARIDIFNGGFSISEHGLVTTSTMAIGTLGTGSSSITSGNWNVLDALIVGSSGTGTLSIDGGVATTGTAGGSAANSTLGLLAGGSGAVTVSNGGAWNSYGDLTVGAGGVGALTVANLGYVLVTGTLGQGAFGTINVNDGGTLQIGDAGATGTLAAANLTNDGSLIFDRATDAVSATAISGAGSLTKRGAGSLALTGSSTYTGVTSLEGGSLLIEGYLGDTSITANPGTLIGGGGIVDGSLVVFSGTLSPGSAATPHAILTVGSLLLDATSDDVSNAMLTMMSITGTIAGSEYDQIKAATAESSPLTYGGVLALNMNGIYVDETTFDLFNSFTSTSGTFSAISFTATGPYAGLTFTKIDGTENDWQTGWTTAEPNGQKLIFNSSTGQLVVVPEPATVVLAAAGAVLAGAARWRRSRRSRPRC